MTVMVMIAVHTGNGARAAVSVQVFQANGVLQNGTVLGGTVNIDVVTGQVVQSYLSFTPNPGSPAVDGLFTNLVSSDYIPFANLTGLLVRDAAGNQFGAGLAGPLVDYTGGTFCSVSTFCFFGGGASGSGSVLQYAVDQGSLSKNRSLLASGTLTPLGTSVQVFQANGALQNGTVLGGTVNIDVVTGQVVQSYLSFTPNPGSPAVGGLFTNLVSSDYIPFANLTGLLVRDAAGNQFGAGLAGPLVDYAGGTFCSVSTFCFFGGGASGSGSVLQYAVDQGSLSKNRSLLASGTLSLVGTPIATSVPEPMAILLFLTALAALATTLAWHRASQRTNDPKAMAAVA